MLWLLAVFATVAAVLGWITWRSERNQRVALEGEQDVMRQELSELHKQAERRDRSVAERDRDRAELRRKLEKARKRAFEASAEHSGLEARIANLERTVDERSRESHAALERSSQLAEQLERERQQRIQESAKTQAAVRDDEQQSSRIARRAEAAEAKAEELGRRLLVAERDASRYRSRERTHRRLYLVIKGELDAARDRLRTLEAHLARFGAVPEPRETVEPEVQEESRE